MISLSKLNVVVTGSRSPHVEETDRIVVICEPAVTCYGIISVLTGVEECVPLLVFKVDCNTNARESGLEIFSDSLVIFVGVVKICERLEN